MDNKLYWESQKGNLCRLHSLNAYFGYKKISEIEFANYCIEYDKYIKNYYGETINSENYDIFPTYSLISYIIYQIEKKYCHFIPIGELNNESITLEKIINKTTSFFVFNQKHVYTIKIYEGKWNKIDSLSGILPIQLSSLKGKIGFIIPRDNQYLDFDKTFHLEKIKKYLNKNNIETTTELTKWIDENYKIKLLDDMEVNLAHLNQIIIIKGEKLSTLNKLMTGFYNNKLNKEFIMTRLPKTLYMLNLVIKNQKN